MELKTADKPLLYIETSVISAYFDFKKQDATRKAETRRFFDEIVPRYEAVVSDAVLTELGNTPRALEQKQLLNFATALPRIPLTPEAVTLAEEYIAQNIVPTAKLFDAYHVAIATLHQIRFLTSWNYDHIANVKTEELVNAYNTLKGLPHIAIVFPTQLFHSS